MYTFLAIAISLASQSATPAHKVIIHEGTYIEAKPTFSACSEWKSSNIGGSYRECTVSK